MVESVLSDIGDSAGESSAMPSIQAQFQSKKILKVRIANDGGLLSYVNGEVHRIKATELAEFVPGFEVGKAVSLKVVYHEPRKVVYSFYKGGHHWLPAYPPDLPKPKGTLSITVTVLSQEDFLQNLPKLSMDNTDGLRWMPARVVITGSILSMNDFKLFISQYPTIEGVSSFSMEALPSGPIGWNADGTFFQFQIADMFGHRRTLRIYHNGYGRGWLGLRGSMGFERVCLASYDGFRLRLITKAGREFSAATLYMNDPSLLYDVGPMVESDAETTGDLPSLSCQQTQVLPRRVLESEMLRSVATYAHGRLGAEIAYAILVKNLGLDDMVLVEPSIGGKDLYTSDRTILVQARLLTKPGPLQPRRIRRTLRIQLYRLIRKLREDFAHNPNSEVGYAILSYLNTRSCSVTTTACEIRNHQLETGYCMQAAL